MAKLPDTLTLCVDPGEMTGWSVWRGPVLVGAGQTKMWEFADDVYERLAFDAGHKRMTPFLGDPGEVWVLPDREEHVNQAIDIIVCEDWRLYPGKLNALAWDQCRTARLIGALTMAARLYDLQFVLQPAAIKQAAVTAGAEELFYKPQHENRHQNDSIMHGVYFNAYGPEGDPRVVNRVTKAEEASRA